MSCGTCTLCMRAFIGKGKEYKPMTNKKPAGSEPATALETLGTILPADGGFRDAIHLAVVPVTSDEKVFPGQHLALVKDSQVKVTTAGDTIGIVDPFLSAPVFPGETFWLVLYPRTITSLRHAWDHPAFTDEKPIVEIKVPIRVNEWGVEITDEVNRSTTAILDIMNNADAGSRYEEFVNNALDSLGNDYITVYGSDAYGDVPDTLWDHIIVVTGKPLPGGMKPQYFSCSC